MVGSMGGFGVKTMQADASLYIQKLAEFELFDLIRYTPTTKALKCIIHIV